MATALLKNQKLATLKVGGRAAPLLGGLLAYWNLDEASGVRNDSHTSGYHLTDTNTVTSNPGVGAGQTAAEFATANSEYLIRATSSAPDLLVAAPFEAVCWFRSDGTDPTVQEGIVECAASANSSRGWRIHRGTNGILVFLFVDESNTLRTVGGGADDDATAEGWYFINVRHTGTQGELSTNLSTADTTVNTFGTMTEAGQAFAIGRRDTNDDVYLDGRVQAVGVWGRLLTSSERTFLYNSGTAARLYADISSFAG